MLSVTLEGRVGALDLRVDLAVEAEPLVLVGPNGSGKTSLLLMMLGVLRPERGRIEVGGEALFDTERGIDLPPEDRSLGYLPQDYALFPHASVLENVCFGLECRRVAKRERRDRARQILASLDVEALADRLPHTLSGGEAQRVALARALAAEPRALLLDEPLAALDAGVRKQMRAYLPERLARLGLPAVVVTHDAADAAAFARRVTVLEAGRVVQRGTLEELAAAPSTPFVAEFVSS